MSSTLISKVEQGTVEELEKALTEAKAKGATHFQIGQSLCGTKKSGPLYYAEVIQFIKELSPVEILESRMTALRSDYNKTFEQYQKEVGGICPKCNIAISKGGGCINHKDCPMKPIQ